MNNNYGLHIQKFNERVSSMTQTRAQNLVLTTTEAANLQSDIFALLAHVAALSQQLNSDPEKMVEVVMDGGGFK
jgi:hypothetical protein